LQKKEKSVKRFRMKKGGRFGKRLWLVKLVRKGRVEREKNESQESWV